MKSSIAVLMMFSAALAHAQESAPAADYSGSRDQLKPSQVNYEGESTNPANASGFFFGAGMSFGQALPTDDGSPGLAYLFHFEPGYQIETGRWSRLEISLDTFAGKFNFRHAENAADTGGKVAMPIGFGIMPKIGYGYSLGGKMIGLVKAGAGPVFGKFSVGDLESDDRVSGLATLIGWEMIIPAGSALDFTAGISNTHYQFDVDKLRNADDIRVKYDRSVQTNAAEVRLGLRLRL